MPFRLPGGGPRISVDNDRCELYGICAMEAPDVFDPPVAPGMLSSG